MFSYVNVVDTCVPEPIKGTYLYNADNSVYQSDTLKFLSEEGIELKPKEMAIR